MNKRGEEADPRGFTLTAIIILIALGLVLFFVFTNGATLKRWFDFIPSFNETAKGAEQSGYIRYDIWMAKLQYHNGVWSDFSEDKLKIKETEFSRSVLINGLREFYRNSDIKVNDVVFKASDPLRKPLLNLLQLSHGNLMPSKDYYSGTKLSFSYLSMGYTAGSSDSNVFTGQFNERAGDYVFKYSSNVGEDSSGYIYFGKVIYNAIEGKTYLFEWAESAKDYNNKGMSREDRDITSKVSGISDKIYKESIQLRHNQLEKTPISLEGKNYCVSIYNNNYLIVDLMKPVNAEVNCLA